MRSVILLLAAILLAGGAFVTRPAHAADAGFTRFVEGMWPEARAAGVSRETFDRETRGLEPDYKLPDLALPGRPETGAATQPEFVRTPADYRSEEHTSELQSH